MPTDIERRIQASSLEAFEARVQEWKETDIPMGNITRSDFVEQDLTTLTSQNGTRNIPVKPTAIDIIFDNGNEYRLLVRSFDADTAGNVTRIVDDLNSVWCVYQHIRMFRVLDAPEPADTFIGSFEWMEPDKYYAFARNSSTGGWDPCSKVGSAVVGGAFGMAEGVAIDPRTNQFKPEWCDLCVVDGNGYLVEGTARYGPPTG